MAKKKGRSEKKKDWLGRPYIQHYDANNNESGRSERKKTVWGKNYTQHYDSNDDKRGRSERKETLLGRSYTQKYNLQGEKSGTSEKKNTLLGKTYTQHYDSEGNQTDRSERKQTWFGKQYIERYGNDAPHKTSRNRSSSESSWSGYSDPDATSQPGRTSWPTWLIVSSAILGIFLLGSVAKLWSPFLLSVERHLNSLSGGGSVDQPGKGTDVQGLKALFTGRKLPAQRPPKMIVLETGQQNSGFAFSDSHQLSYNGNLFTGVDFASVTKLAVSKMSPDGIHALVFTFYPTESRVIVLNLESLIAGVLASSRRFYLWNAWSPNGAHVLFADTGEVDDSLYVADMVSMQAWRVNVALQVSQNTEMQHYVLHDVHWTTEDEIQIRKAVFCNVYERNNCPDEYRSHPLRELTVMADKFGNINGHRQSLQRQSAPDLSQGNHKVESSESQTTPTKFIQRDPRTGLVTIEATVDLFGTSESDWFTIVTGGTKQQTFLYKGFPDRRIGERLRLTYDTRVPDGMQGPIGTAARMDGVIVSMRVIGVDYR
jgi:hypothetical protein